MVQPLAISFLFPSTTLVRSMIGAGARATEFAGLTILALVLACAGMWLGQVLRLKLSVAIFRRSFFGGLLALGVYLALRALT